MERQLAINRTEMYLNDAPVWGKASGIRVLCRQPLLVQPCIAKCDFKSFSVLFFI